MKTSILVAGLALFSFGHLYSTPFQQIKVGENVRVTSQQQNLHHVESDLYVNPKDPNHWIAAAIVYTDPIKWEYHCAVWVTNNAGRVWRRTDFPDGSADPQVIIDENNNVYLSCLGQSGVRGEVYYTSGDGGATWSKPHRIPGGHDHPFLSIYKDDVYWVSTTNRNTELNVRKASKGGLLENMTTLKFPQNENQNDNFKHTNLSDGTLVIPFINYYSGEGGPKSDGAYVVRSTDGGKTFSERILISKEVGTAKGLASLHADISNTNNKDNLYLVYGKGQGRNESLGIAISKSTDKGKTWHEKMVRSPYGGVNGFVNPAAAINRNGVLGINWVERRLRGGRMEENVYFTASLDGGLSFLDPVKVTEVNSSLRSGEGEANIGASFRGGGHYDEMVALPDGSFQLIWSDARSGIYQLYTANVVVNND